LEHLPGIRKGAGVIEIGKQRGAVSFQNLADQKKIFFLIADQQHAQRRIFQGRFCDGKHPHDSVTCYHRNLPG
jgi:hypothetical protein